MMHCVAYPFSYRDVTGTSALRKMMSIDRGCGHAMHTVVSAEANEIYTKEKNHIFYFNKDKVLMSHCSYRVRQIYPKT